MEDNVDMVQFAYLLSKLEKYISFSTHTKFYHHNCEYFCSKDSIKYRKMEQTNNLINVHDTVLNK